MWLFCKPLRQWPFWALTLNGRGHLKKEHRHARRQTKCQTQTPLTITWLISLPKNCPLGCPIGMRRGNLWAGDFKQLVFFIKSFRHMPVFALSCGGGPSDKPAYSVLLCGCAVPCVGRWLFTWTASLRVCACVLHPCVQHMRVGNVRVQHQESFTGWVRMEQARVS